ncbi:hypothetical protein J4430_00975 [Candidatus Woesearchaeota archaeon]|nr:hypothetical protein [Candidatus Woesearchaeota archaeon]
MMVRRGQVTILIVVGIVLFAILSLVVFFIIAQKPQPITELERKNVEQEVVSCIEKGAQQARLYTAALAEFPKGGQDQQLREFFKRNMESYLLTNQEFSILDCVESSKANLAPLQVTQGKQLEVVVNIQDIDPMFAEIEVYLPILIEKGGVQERIENFVTTHRTL